MKRNIFQAVVLHRDRCCADNCKDIAAVQHDDGSCLCMDHAVDHDAPETFVNIRTGVRLES